MINKTSKGDGQVLCRLQEVIGDCLYATAEGTVDFVGDMLNDMDRMVRFIRWRTFLATLKIFTGSWQSLVWTNFWSMKRNAMHTDLDLGELAGALKEQKRFARKPRVAVVSLDINSPLLRHFSSPREKSGYLPTAKRLRSGLPGIDPTGDVRAAVGN
ncbi:hypothetical protein [Pseudodesulfovibrio sp.]|uniref:hypothetical protein n=1 Tax=unclassified Pseudodesulfovibrio TaxID=2661612 RepID=UPI003B006420